MVKINNVNRANLKKVSLSPCIISWAKFALEIKFNKPQNSKKCSEKYWIRIIDSLVQLYPDSHKNKKKAYKKFHVVKK